MKGPWSLGDEKYQHLIFEHISPWQIVSIMAHVSRPFGRSRASEISSRFLKGLGTPDLIAGQLVITLELPAIAASGPF